MLSRAGDLDTAFFEDLRAREFARLDWNHIAYLDFAKLPVETAWGQASLNPMAVAASKLVAEPVWTKPPDPPLIAMFAPVIKPASSEHK